MSSKGASTEQLSAMAKWIRMRAITERRHRLPSKSPTIKWLSAITECWGAFKGCKHRVVNV
eukprot:1159659-Pelagomonas_calceolata.AAC.8